MKLENSYSLEKIIDKTSIDKRIFELSKEISSYFPFNEDLVVICVLNGSIIFCSDLIKNMKHNIILDTIRVKSYDKKKRGKLNILNDISININGKNVLIIEDIIETGQTISFLYDHISSKNPNNIKIVSFLFKSDVYKLNVSIDWVGFYIDNDFVVGYGLDYNEKFRNYNAVYRLIDETKK